MTLRHITMKNHVGFPGRRKLWIITRIPMKCHSNLQILAKKGQTGGLEPFPEHMPDPIPAPPGRRPPPPEDAPPSWRPGCPAKVTNPMPSVATALRNLRSEHPRSFV